MTTRHMTANDVLTAYWDGSVPVRPIALASQMDVKVFRRSGMSESGYVYLDDELRPRIVFNADEPPVRQRFTIAHELGHHALGHLTPGKREWRDPKENFFSTAYNPKEVAANRFAAELLMPEDAIRVAISEGTKTISGLARTFHVSEVAMKFRLKNLGMLRG